MGFPRKSQKEIRREFALECRLTALSRADIAELDPASLARSFDLPQTRIEEILATEKRRRA